MPASGSVTTIAMRDGVPYTTDAQFSTPDAQSYFIQKVTFSAPTMEATAEAAMSEATVEPTAAG